MSDLRALVRLKEKELRRLEWTLMAHKAQETPGTLGPEHLREELQDCRSQQQVRWTPPSFQGESHNREQDFGLLWQTRFVSGCPTREIKAGSLQDREDILVLPGLPLACPAAAAQIHPAAPPSSSNDRRSLSGSAVAHRRRGNREPWLVLSMFQQRLCERPGCDGDVAGARPILKELQAFLQR